MPIFLQAGLWGLLAGTGLLIGAAVAFLIDLPHRLIAAVMGFGGGVLIAVLSVDLMEEALPEAARFRSLAVFCSALSFSAVSIGCSRSAARSTAIAAAGVLSNPRNQTSKAAGWPSRRAPCLMQSPSRL